MPLNVFELISISGTPGYEGNFNFTEGIDDFLFNNYVALFDDGSADVNLVPYGWNTYNFNDTAAMGSGLPITQLLNNDFGANDGSDWVFDEVDSPTGTRYSSFAKISGWKIKMYSVDNDGMNHGNTSKIELDATPGNRYAKGNERVLFPTLNLVGSEAHATPNVTDRVGNVLIGDFIPNVNNYLATTNGGVGDDYGRTSFSVHSNMIDFGCLQGINTTEQEQYCTILPNGSYQTTGRMVRLSTMGQGAQLGVAYAWNFFSANDVTSSWVQQTIFPNGNPIFSTINGWGMVHNAKKHVFPILRFRDIFPNKEYSDRVTFRAKLTYGNTVTQPQWLPNSYVDGVNADFVTASTSYSVNTTDGSITGTSDGAWRPDFAYFSGEAYYNMTSYVYVSASSGGRLHVKNKPGHSLGTSVSTMVNIDCGKTYRIFFKVGLSTNPNWNVSVEYVNGYTFIDQPFPEGGGQSGGQPLIAQSLGNTTNDAFLKFNAYPLSNNLSGGAYPDGFNQTQVRVKITITNVASNSDRQVAFNYIRFEKSPIESKSLTRNHFDTYHSIFGVAGLSYSSEFQGNYSTDTTNTAGWIVLSTSDFKTRPDGTNTDAEGTYQSAALDDDDVVQTKIHQQIGEPDEQGILMSRKVFANPYKYNDILRADETFYLNPDDVMVKDSDGFFTPGAIFETQAELKIGSNNLNLFFDGYTGTSIVNTNLYFRELHVETNKNSHITVASDGINQNTGNLTGKASFVYDYRTSSVATDPLDNETNQFGVRPPEMEIENVFPPDQINGEYQVQINWDVDSITATAGTTADKLILDYGEGTPIIAQIDASNLSSNVQQVPQGANLRFRHITAEEKGSAIEGLHAIIDSVSVSEVATSEIFVVGSKHGDETSDNLSTNPLMPENQAAFRVRTLNNLGAAVNWNYGVGASENPRLRKTLDGAILSALEITYKITTRSIATNNVIRIIENTENPDVSNATVINAHTNTLETEFTRNRALIGSLQQNTPITFTVEYANDGTAAPLDSYITEIKITYTAITGGDIVEDTLDLNEDFDFCLNLKNKNFEELSEGSGSYSKTFKLPATAKNRRVFDFKDEIESSSGNFVKLKKNVVKEVNAKVRAEGIDVFSGTLELLGSERDEYGATFLKTIMKGGNASWVDSLKSKKLIDLSSNIYSVIDTSALSGYAQTPTTSISDNALYDSPSNEIVFPLIDNGKWFVPDSDYPDNAAVGFENIKAGYRISLVLRKIFEDEGYTLSSQFMNLNSEWTSEYNPEYVSEFNNLVGIAPSMVVREVDIKSNNFKGRMTNTQQSYFKRQEDLFPTPAANNGLNGVRPKIYSLTKMLSPSDLVTALPYYLDFAFVKFNEDVTADGITVNNTQEFPSGQLLGTNSAIDPSFENNASLRMKSKFNVTQEGYYDVSVYINGDFNRLDGTNWWTKMWMSPKDLAEFETDESLFPTGDYIAKRYVSAALVTEHFSLLNSSNDFDSHHCLAALMFDLNDKSSVELYNTNYDTTRISLRNTQHLKPGIDYYLVVLDVIATDRKDSEGVRLNSFGTTFTLNEVYIDIKLSDKVRPLDGLLSLIYNNYSNAYCPKISWRNILPDITQLDFVSEVSKLFNLTWQVDPITRVITVEPFYDFYNRNEEASYGQGVQYIDWTSKALIVEVEEDFILTGNLSYSMNDDSSDWSLSTYSSSNFINETKYGDKYLTINKNKNGDVKELSLGIFAPMVMGVDVFLAKHAFFEELSETIYIPRIWSEPDSPLEPELNEQKPAPNNSHSHKLAFIVGSDYEVVPGESLSIDYCTTRNFVPYGAVSSDYVYGKKTHTVSTVYNLLFVTTDSPSDGFPNPTFMDSLGQTGIASITKGGLFNEFHQPYIQQLLLRDKHIIAEVNLGVSDIYNFDFRNLVKIEENLYYVSRIVDYNFSGETTKVELVLATINTDTTEVIL